MRPTRFSRIAEQGAQSFVTYFVFLIFSSSSILSFERPSLRARCAIRTSLARRRNYAIQFGQRSLGDTAAETKQICDKTIFLYVFHQHKQR